MNAHLIKLGVVLAALVPGWLSIAQQQRAPKPVDRALVYVKEKGDAWIGEKNCVSCHMVTGTVWSLKEAEESGHKVDADATANLRAWVAASVFQKDPGPEGLAQVILAKSANQENAPFEAMRAKLLSKQRPDGSWSPEGQTPEQKRPLAEGREVVTMWAMLAAGNSPRAKAAVARAWSTIDLPSSKVSTEWHALRLLVALRLEKSSAEIERVKALIGAQNKDGGWGWVVGEESDAIATGQAIYALSFVPGRTPAVRESIQRARKLLLGSQLPDGSWSAKSTLAQHKDEVIPTSRYWATTWAVTGLCRTEKLR